MPATTAAATMSPSRYTNFLIMQPRHAAPPVAICNHLRSTGLTKDTDSVTERGSKVRVVGERSFAHCDSVPETFLLFIVSSEHSRTLGPPSTPCPSDASLKWTDIKASPDFDPAISRFALSLLDRLIKSDSNERWVGICRKFQRFLRRGSSLFLMYEDAMFRSNV